MAKGSKIIPVRFPPELLEQVLAQIQQRNRYTADVPWDFSAFVRKAVEEKLKHMARSRGGSPVAVVRPVAPPADPEAGG